MRDGRVSPQWLGERRKLTDAEVVVLAGRLGVDPTEDLLAELESILDLLGSELDLALGHGTLTGVEALVRHGALR